MAATDFVNTFAEIVASGNYKQDNIYNADETGVYWKVVPDSTLALAGEKQAFGTKMPKERITPLVCANSSGRHKIDLLAIGKSARPRGFPVILPVKYQSSKKAWMTREIFEWWYDYVFIPQVEDFQSSNNSPGNVLLVLDNAPVHHKSTNFDRKNGKFKVVFLPPNVTSVVQPMDQAIIATFKRLYRKALLERLVNTDGEQDIAKCLKDFKLIDALFGMKQAWTKVTMKSLTNGWKDLFKRIEWRDGEVEFFYSADDVVEEEKTSDKEEKEDPLAQIETVNGRNWMTIDEDDPGYGVVDEDDLEKCFFETNEDSEDDCGNENDQEETVTNEKALSAGLTFLKWIEVQENVRGEDKAVVKRLVELATKKANNKKQSAITDFFRTIA